MTPILMVQVVEITKNTRRLTWVMFFLVKHCSLCYVIPAVELLLQLLQYGHEPSFERRYWCIIEIVPTQNRLHTV